LSRPKTLASEENEEDEENEELGNVSWSVMRHFSLAKPVREGDDRVEGPEQTEREGVKGWLLLRLIPASRGSVIVGLDKVRVLTFHIVTQ
jgi:hypothetical protein